MAHLHVLVLGDQLNAGYGPLAAADPASTSVLMIESLEFARSLPHHKQKLIHCFSAMRHFAQDLQAAGFSVHYKKAEESFGSGVRAYLRQMGKITLTLMQPNDRGYSSSIRRAVEAEGGMLDVRENTLWLSSGADFASWAEGRKQLSMEHFYRLMRRRSGYLMQTSGEPEGDQWNYDHENRQTPEPGQQFPEGLIFEPDEITREVISFVSENFADHFGEAEPFSWPVTRQEARQALEHFCGTRLRYFGPFEDAMVEAETQLYHSLLSPLLNCGLLHPREVIETALDYYHDGRRKIPLNSIEGFVRQILGWREFMFQVYHYLPADTRNMNKLNHRRSLPDFFWTGETRMNCLKQCLEQVQQTGHSHHIQRLMVLGNFALIAQINPQELLDWFTASHIDALEWVMVPNVIGMSQYADGGGFTSKPYAASANYINKMSNYCQNCHYQPKKKTGADACPFNSLYWDFINRHREHLSDNPRMNMILANWKRQDRAQKKSVLEQASTVKRKLRREEL